MKAPKCPKSSQTGWKEDPEAAVAQTRTQEGCPSVEKPDVHPDLFVRALFLCF